MISEFREKLHKMNFLEFDGFDPGDCVTLDMSDEELFAELTKAPVTDLFLRRFDEAEIRELLGRFGILDDLEKMGYPEVEIEINTRRVYNHRLFVYFEVRDYDHILIELRLRDGYFRPAEQFVEGCEVRPMSLILVDWLMLQDPGARFTDDRPALPEQRYPGLGLLRNFIPMVREVVTRIGRQGVLDVPEHFHGALFYSRWFRFYSPEMEGRL